MVGGTKDNGLPLYCGQNRYVQTLTRTPLRGRAVGVWTPYATRAPCVGHAWGMRGHTWGNPSHLCATRGTRSMHDWRTMPEKCVLELGNAFSQPIALEQKQKTDSLDCLFAEFRKLGKDSDTFRELSVILVMFQ